MDLVFGSFTLLTTGSFCPRIDLSKIARNYFHYITAPRININYLMKRSFLIAKWRDILFWKGSFFCLLNSVSGVPCTLTTVYINPPGPYYRKFTGFLSMYGKCAGKFHVIFLYREYKSCNITFLVSKG